MTSGQTPSRRLQSAPLVDRVITGGYDDHWRFGFRFGSRLAQPIEHQETIFTGHIQIHQDQIGMLLLGLPHSRESFSREDGLVAAGLEKDVEAEAHSRVIIHDQDLAVTQERAARIL